MSSEFSYLGEKIKEQKFSVDPFKHVYIEGFLNKDHFDKLLSLDEITLGSQGFSDDQGLLEGLKKFNYKPIDFPGCFLDEKKYLKWKRNKSKTGGVASSCEGAGMTFRLNINRDGLLKDLSTYLAGDEFNRIIAEKFGVDFNDCAVDHGIQKYLDGYEISPHPDIRSKAATYMLNLNHNPDSEKLTHHTHFLKFKSVYKYIQSLWENSLDVNRGWVPWDWCESIHQQTKNNSIVIFSPSNDTLHAVKADYDHLRGQRTQAYGNLWYRSVPASYMLPWESLDIPGGKVLEGQKRNNKIREVIAKKVPSKFKELVKSVSKSRKPKDNLK
jgi:hypothetical protein